MVMFIVIVLKSVSGTPVTLRTERMERGSSDGKPERTWSIISLTWAGRRACRGATPSRRPDGGGGEGV